MFYDYWKRVSCKSFKLTVVRGATFKLENKKLKQASKFKSGGYAKNGGDSPFFIDTFARRAAALLLGDAIDILLGKLLTPVKVLGAKAYDKVRKEAMKAVTVFAVTSNPSLKGFKLTGKTDSLEVEYEGEGGYQNGRDDTHCFDRSSKFRMKIKISGMDKAALSGFSLSKVGFSSEISDVCCPEGKNCRQLSAQAANCARDFIVSVTCFLAKTFLPIQKVQGGIQKVIDKIIAVPMKAEKAAKAVAKKAEKIKKAAEKKLKKVKEKAAKFAKKLKKMKPKFGGGKKKGKRML